MNQIITSLLKGYVECEAIQLLLPPPLMINVVIGLKKDNQDIGVVELLCHALAVRAKYCMFRWWGVINLEKLVQILKIFSILRGAMNSLNL